MDGAGGRGKTLKQARKKQQGTAMSTVFLLLRSELKLTPRSIFHHVRSHIIKEQRNIVTACKAIYYKSISQQNRLSFFVYRLRISI
jgi:hypothetical protein